MGGRKRCLCPVRKRCHSSNPIARDFSALTLMAKEDCREPISIGSAVCAPSPNSPLPRRAESPRTKKSQRSRNSACTPRWECPSIARSSRSFSPGGNRGRAEGESFSFPLTKSRVVDYNSYMTAVRIHECGASELLSPKRRPLFPQPTRAFGSVILSVCRPVRAILQHEK